MAPRTFTLQEANSLLPDLSRLLLEAQESKSNHDRLQEKAERYALLASSNGHGIEKELNETRQELAKVAAQLNHLLERAEKMGCEVKDVARGLVDFRIERGDRYVYLCWKLGEPEIGWWHEMDAGFAGRQPLEAS